MSGGRQSYGLLIGGKRHGRDLGELVDLTMRRQPHNIVALPRPGVIDPLDAHGRAPGARAAQSDTYHRRVDCEGNTFWLHTSLLNPRD